MHADPAATVGATLLFAATYVVRRWRQEDLDPSERERQRYAEGEIDLEELERRLDVLEDPEATRIREAVERVSGIGEATSWDLAAEFRSLEELRDADQDRLQEVPNVGPERARALQEAV